ncbi:hypothetical protein Dsin_012389 [Dipteronia sinensis]|uniref:Uncharacterized protein n=1 Tax=Dipteronia sinensis TaxID=43782 RepID=A0AAE0AJ94_9ROSI|nr:hypothetical protein Dsin_012389 [Dipteronia sinensis]
MPLYVKFLKEIISQKSKLEDFDMVALTEECNAIIQNKLPLKLKDHGRFTIPCMIRSLEFVNHLVVESSRSDNLKKPHEACLVQSATQKKNRGSSVTEALREISAAASGSHKTNAHAVVSTIEATSPIKVKKEIDKKKNKNKKRKILMVERNILLCYSHFCLPPGFCKEKKMGYI